MTTIENVKHERTFYKHEQDELRNAVRTPYKKMVTRGVNTVNQGVRFGYYLLDLVFFYIVSFIILFILGVIIIVATQNPDAVYSLHSFSISIPLGFYTWRIDLLSYFLFFAYYSISEGFFGTTLGKLICGYTVIDNQAQKISIGQGCLRSIIRLIPFEAFSCFGERGWHDKWAKAYVVKKSEKAELQKLMGTHTSSDSILDL